MKKITMSSNGDKRILVFTTEHCVPCNNQEKILKGFMVKNKSNIDFDVELLDSKNYPDLIKTYNIIGFPTILIELDGIVTNRMIGCRSIEELENSLF